MISATFCRTHCDILSYLTSNIGDDTCQVKFSKEVLPMKYINIDLRSRPMLILEALMGVAKAHQKKYCWVSQERLIELVGKFGGIWMSRRTLNRDLKFLVDNGWIERIRRHHAGPDGKILFASTLYKFKGKVFNTLYYLANLCKRTFSFFRVPRWVEYKLNQSKIYGASGGLVSSFCGNPVEKGRASPVKGIRASP